MGWEACACVQRLARVAGTQQRSHARACVPPTTQRPLGQAGAPRRKTRWRGLIAATSPSSSKLQGKERGPPKSPSKPRRHISRGSGVSTEATQGCTTCSRTPFPAKCILRSSTGVLRAPGPRSARASGLAAHRMWVPAGVGRPRSSLLPPSRLRPPSSSASSSPPACGGEGDRGRKGGACYERWRKERDDLAGGPVEGNARGRGRAATAQRQAATTPFHTRGDSTTSPE